jgi:hypothetical protein
MSLHDELVDVTTLILGLCSEAEAAREWPSLLGRLSRIRDAIGRRRPAQRRSPAHGASADWLRRSLMDAPIADEDRAEALEVLATIKAMVRRVEEKNQVLTREKVHGRGR